MRGCTVFLPRAEMHCRGHDSLRQVMSKKQELNWRKNKTKNKSRLLETLVWNHKHTHIHTLTLCKTAYQFRRPVASSAHTCSNLKHGEKLIWFPWVQPAEWGKLYGILGISRMFIQSEQLWPELSLKLYCNQCDTHTHTRKKKKIQASKTAVFHWLANQQASERNIQTRAE